MGNPYAPRVSRTATEPQSLSELEQFVRRLRDLGATDEEIQTVRDTWDEFDEGFTIEQRTAVTLLPDDELRAELLATREEYRHDTRTEGEQEQIDDRSHMERLRADVADWIGQPVAKVLERVGEDAVLAIAVLDLETGPDGAGRKTLIEPLQALVAGSDEGGIPVEVVTGGEGEPLAPITEGEHTDAAIEGERIEVEELGDGTGPEEISEEPPADARGGADGEGSSEAPGPE